MRVIARSPKTIRSTKGIVSGCVLLALLIALGSHFIWRHHAPTSRTQQIARSTSSQIISSVPAVSAGAHSIGPAEPPSHKSAEPTKPMASREASTKEAELFEREFQVSTSVESGCKPASPRGSSTACDKIRHDLSMMAREMRDPAWASDMEARLQEYFERQSLEGLSVRNIECRVSLCAIEVAVIKDQPIVFVFGSPNPLNDKLISPTYFANGEETGPSGEQLEVLLVTYRRR